MPVPRDKRENLFLIVMVLAVMSFGTLGYVLIEGWGFLDAFFMTVETLVTVGYGEVHPLSTAGRVFTIVLIFVGVGVAMTVLPALAGRFMQRQVLWLFKKEDMLEAISKLDRHIIFCGYSRLCQTAVRHFDKDARDLVIIEKNEEKLEQARASGFLVLKGDATRDEVLIQAGVRKAAWLVSLLPNDADNLYVVLSSKELNPEIRLMSRADDETGEKRLLSAGAERIVAPYRVGGQKIAHGLLRPYVTDFLDLAASGQGTDLMVEELTIPKACPLAGKTLIDSGLRQKTNILIAAIIGKGGMQVNPAGTAVLEAGATLIGFGRRGDFDVLEQMLEGKR